MKTTLRAVVLTAAGLVTLAACRPGRDSSTDTSPASPADTASSMGDMSGMRGHAGMMGGAQADSMHAHMVMMEAMSGDQMKAMMAPHRQMVANMLSRMNAEMRSMNMPGDAAWNATVDSLRQDLSRMPDMSGQQLKDMMPAHHARIMRLLDAHGKMMGTK